MIKGKMLFPFHSNQILAQLGVVGINSETGLFERSLKDRLPFNYEILHRPYWYIDHAVTDVASPFLICENWIAGFKST